MVGLRYVHRNGVKRGKTSSTCCQPCCLRGWWKWGPKKKANMGKGLDLPHVSAELSFLGAGRCHFGACYHPMAMRHHHTFHPSQVRVGRRHGAGGSLPLRPVLGSR